MVKRLALFVLPALIAFSVVVGVFQYLYGGRPVPAESGPQVSESDRTVPSDQTDLSDPSLGSPGQIPEGLATRAEDFVLLDHKGRSHELRRYAIDAKAIVLYSTATGCPIARQSVPALKALHAEFEPQGVVFLLVNASTYDDRSSVEAEAAEFGLDLPVLMDETQHVLAGLGVERTCEAIVIDPATYRIVYRGAIDDRIDYTAQRPEGGTDFLRDALAAFLAGQPVETTYAAPKGCLVDYMPLPMEVSYVNDIAPIIAGRCVACHSKGKIAPFAFEKYQDVSGRGGMIREVVLSRRMPPWHADPHVGTFENDRALTVDETRTLLAWIDAGAPKDGEADPLEPDGGVSIPLQWPLGEPDLIVELPEVQQLPASGAIDYRYFNVPSGLTEDKWLRAADVRPTNLEVTHHVLVFVIYPPELQSEQPDYDGGLDGYFAIYLPGTQPAPLPDDTGKWIPAGSTFQFQMHYTATGKEEQDRTKVALYFYDEKPSRELATRAATTVDFLIPPNDSEVPAAASHFIARDSILFSVTPHMHYRGKWFQYEIEYPDGEREAILSVPYYDFNWQTEYVFEEPIALPAGSRIIAAGAWDNSVRNPMNPDPNKAVVFGEQSFDEMFVGYVNYSYDPNAPAMRRDRSGRGRGRDREVVRTGVPINAETIVGTEWTGGKYRMRFEADGVMHVNDTVQGTYTIDGNKVNFHVAGQDHVFTIKDDLLLSDDYPLQRLK
jgi:peroxiredoxin